MSKLTVADKLFITFVAWLMLLLTMFAIGYLYTVFK